MNERSRGVQQLAGVDTSLLEGSALKLLVSREKAIRLSVSLSVSAAPASLSPSRK